MIERQILRVVYAPFKAFEDIVKNPVVKGPLLILLLGAVAAAITQFVSFSKVNVQLEPDVEVYVPFTSTNTFGGRILLILIDHVLSLSLGWFIFTGVIIFVTKAFRVNEGSWRALFFVIGFTLITSVVGTLITALMISPLPTVRLGWGIWNPSTQEMEEAARQEILKAYEPWFYSSTYQFLYYLPFILQGWSGVLAAIALRALLKVSWEKAVAISAIASVLTFLIRLVLI